MRPKANTGKTGGFQRGPMPPLWHTTLLARCSVLYLLARLTGEAGRAMRFMSCLDRQKNGWRGCVAYAGPKRHLDRWWSYTLTA